MKKIIVLLAVCVFIFSGCAKAELEAENLELENQIDELNDEINDLEDEVESLNSTIDGLNETNGAIEKNNSELAAQIGGLQKENEELLAAIEDLKGPGIDVLLGSWMGNSYINRYFDISIDKPQDWSYADDTQLGQVMGLGLDIVSSLSGYSINTIEDETIIPLFYLYEGSDINTSSSNIFLTMTKGSLEYDLSSYVQAYIPQLDSILSTFGTTSYSDVEVFDVNGMEMVILEAEIEIAGTDSVMCAEYSYFYKNGYLGSLSANYLSENEDMLAEIVGTMSFN